MTSEASEERVTDIRTSEARISADSTPPPDSEQREIARDLSEEAQRVQDMLAEGGGVVEPHVPVSDDSIGPELQSNVERPQSRILGWLEDVSHKWGTTHLKKLVRKKGRLSQTMGVVPESMHRVANQTRLVLELIDDFRDGTYREISWRSMALLTGGVLYAVSPADVIPDVIPIIGQLDDLVLLAVVTRLVNNDLREYCRFKGYDEREYFRPKKSSAGQ